MSDRDPYRCNHGYRLSNCPACAARDDAKQARKQAIEEVLDLIAAQWMREAGSVGCLALDKLRAKVEAMRDA